MKLLSAALLALVLAFVGACSSEPIGSAVSDEAGPPSSKPEVPVVPIDPGGPDTTQPSLEGGNAAPVSSAVDGGDATPSLSVDAADVPATEAGAATPEAGGPPPAPPPADLVKCMDTKPYVESKCTPTTFAGWPHPAQACTYSTPIGTLAVTVANPSATQVATWIVDAGDSIPAIAHLKESDPKSYLRALQSVASALMIQSGRIFPLQGDVGEDMGGGYVAYPFTKGVTKPCPTGEPHCYCRINSLSRADYCAYQASLGKESVTACRARVGYGQGAADNWLDECISNHSAAWDHSTNLHIRAQVWARINGAGLGATASGSQVVNALDTSYGISSTTVSSFCR